MHARGIAPENMADCAAAGSRAGARPCPEGEGRRGGQTGRDRQAHAGDFADGGYFNSLEIKACEDAGITAFVPKPMTSNAKAHGRFGKADFVYIAKDDEYRCPTGQRAIFRFSRLEDNLELRLYWPSACPNCALRDQCTTSSVRRIRRWEHEAVVDRMQQRLNRKPDAMTLRRSTIEHVFGTLKHWMGSTHFLMKTMAHVGTEMSLHVLAYNLKRVMSVLGIAKTMKAMRLTGA